MAYMYKLALFKYLNHIFYNVYLSFNFTTYIYAKHGFKP